MTLPGTTITVSDTPPSNSRPTDVGTWFVAGLSERGSGPTLVRSLSEYEAAFGSRVTYGLLYDSLDAFFREGGYQAYVSRVVGPDAVSATADLYDASGSSSGDVSLTVTALDAGDWANDLNVEVLAGVSSGFRIQITSDTDDSLEITSNDLADSAEAVLWSLTSDYVRITLGTHSAEVPRAQGPTSLALGDDDRSSITDDDWLAAITLFTKDLGPGQVGMPGRTATQARSDLLAHAATNNRRALLDVTDTETESTISAEGTALQAADDNRYGALFGPWASIPGITLGTTRDVPYTAIEAGIIARNGSNGLNANIAAAGGLGQSRYALSLKASFTDDERDTLNSAGVNIAREMLGGVRTYGYRSLANPTTDANWLDFGNSRLIMQIAALCDAIGEDYVFAQLDGQGHKIAEFGGRLIGALRPFWVDGSLFGATPDEAFLVDVGSSVNTPTTLSNNELRAYIEVKPSPMAERIPINLIKTPIDQAV